MEVNRKEITIRELVKDYDDNGDDGVRGYGGKLDIRPPYQREFIYKDEQRDAVIDTLTKGFPLNVMYWAVRDDGRFEIIDGQQRTISICQYVAGQFSFKDLYFHNLQDDKQNDILDYKLTVYHCQGKDSEKLEWFKTINIAGEELADQEMRNAVYHGTWVTDIKRYFSKRNCPAYNIGSDYMNGSAIRQDYLETVIKWQMHADGIKSIEGYMAKHQNDKNGQPLWDYFVGVIDWVKLVFPEYRKEMKGVNWGILYNEYKDVKLEAVDIEKQLAKLMEDEDVTNKKGIYTYILSGEEKELSIRVFDKNQKREAYQRQEGICPICQKNYNIEDMHGDHIKPWSKGGKTIADNCQMLCKKCNLKKSALQ